MERSYDGSFTVPEISDLLHVSKVTSYKISKLPELNRTFINNQYRVRKKDFWDWYDTQSQYSIYESVLERDKYFSAGDIAQMFGWTTNSAASFIKRHSLRADTTSLRVYVLKDEFIDWYIHQMKYTSKDPRLPPKQISPSYDIHQIKKKLGVKSNHTVYSLYKKGLFDLIRMGGQTRADRESFDRWYRSQCRYPLNRKKRGK